MLIPIYAPAALAAALDVAAAESSPSIRGQDTRLAADDRREEEEHTPAPMELLRAELLESLNSCQNRSVSSALAVTTVVPSGDFAM